MPMHAMPTVGLMIRLANMCPGHGGEQDDGVFERPQPVRGVGHDKQVVLPAMPGLTRSGQFYSPGQHQDGGLARILVLVERSARCKGDHGLAQGVLVTAEGGD